MSISDRDRKLLWGRAANRCAMCKMELVAEAVAPDRDSVIGDECHIVSKKVGGPRGGESWPVPLDSYSNLILLCKVHHKVVDDQPNRFTSDVLRRLKRNHEEWVRVSLTIELDDSDAEEPPQPLHAWRLATGSDVMSLVGGAHAYQLGSDPPKDATEVELIGEFLQDIHDWAESWVEVGPRKRIEAEFELTSTIETLEAQGLGVFGTMRPWRIDLPGKSATLQTAIVQVLRIESADQLAVTLLSTDPS